MPKGKRGDLGTMAGSNSSKDTQEEKSQLHHTDLPSCLSLDVPRQKQWTKSTEYPKGNVMLSCMKVPKDEDPGEEPTCQSYTCVYGPTQRDCSAISSIQTYHPIQCPKAGQEMQQKLQQEMQQGHKCRAKSTEDPKIIDLCCSPEVLEKATARDVEKLGATTKSITTDPQEANLDHQTPKTPRDHRTSRRKTRSSRERRDLGNPTAMLDHPTPTHIQLCLDTNPGYQHPELGQESSQGWVIAVGVLGAVGTLVLLVLLLVRWWRGRREKRRSSKKPLRAEEGLGKGGDGDGGTPGK